MGTGGQSPARRAAPLGARPHKADCSDWRILVCKGPFQLKGRGPVPLTSREGYSAIITCGQDSVTAGWGPLGPRRSPARTRTEARACGAPPRCAGVGPTLPGEIQGPAQGAKTHQTRFQSKLPHLLALQHGANAASYFLGLCFPTCNTGWVCEKEESLSREKPTVPHAALPSPQRCS